MNKDCNLINKQIEKLKEKGLHFKNEEYAKNIILRENYYNLISYDEVFSNIKNNNYVSDTYFEELYAIYNFDRELKNLIFDYINIVETNIKSLIAYHLTEKYGNDILNRNNFNNSYLINDKYNNLKKQIDDNLKRNYNDNNSNLKKYQEEYNNISPLLLIKVFTFGNMTILYSIMKKEDKDIISNILSIDNYKLEKYLKVLNIVRNICAHGDILFNLKLNKNIDFKDYKYHKLLNIEKINNKYKYGNNDLLSILIIFKELLSNNNFYQLFIKIENLLIYTRDELDELSYNNMLNIMGLPNNYNYLSNINELNNFKYSPNPIDTSNIKLNDKYLELANIIAQNNHDIWGLGRKKEGWIYGTVRDDKLKTNPCFIPYEKLSKSEKEYDYNTAIETLKLIQKLGYKIEKESDK